MVPSFVIFSKFVILVNHLVFQGAAHTDDDKERARRPRAVVAQRVRGNGRG